MTLQSPFEISSRLMPALRVADACLSLGYGKVADDGRTEYEVWLDLPDGREFRIRGLRSGVGRRGIQEGFESLLCFLFAAAESLQYERRTGGTGENTSLFAVEVVEWASTQSEAISAMMCEIEGRELISE